MGWHAGALLLVELADRVGLTEALSDALAQTRERGLLMTRAGCSRMAGTASRT